MNICTSNSPTSASPKTLPASVGQTTDMKKILLITATVALSCADNSSVDNKVIADNVIAKQIDTTSKFRTSEIIKKINFKHNSSTIDQKDRELLKSLADICSSDSLSYVKVFAYTDTLGTEKHNDKLSEKRAMVVYNSLGLKKAETKNCVYVTWLGEYGETYDLHFDTAHAQQNCVDVWISTRKKLNVNASR
jgi:outer membrane protein OmpA-like peptidoglycan-associated protein